MSGRKASEVNGLLRNGEQTRNGSMDVLNSSIQKVQDEINRVNSSVDGLNKVMTDVCDVSEDSLIEFPDAAKELKNSIKIWKTECSEIAVKEDSSDIKNNKESILSEYSKADKEADEVRRKLKEKLSKQRNDWYCDAEYSAANQVLVQYRHLSGKVSSLNSEVNKRISHTTKKNSIINDRIAYGKNLIAKIEKMNKDAKRIKELRNQASEAKKMISAEFSEIDSSIAKKFLEGEYDVISKKAEAFSHLSDQDVVNECTDTLSVITEYKIKLNNLYSEYMEKKNSLLSMYENAEYRVSNKVFTHPEDNFKKEGRREAIGLTDFLKTYLREKYVSEINDGLADIKKSIESDEFDQAERQIAEFNELCDMAGKEAVQAHENMMKTILNMLTIKKTMIDLGYTVRVGMNGGHGNPYDGYCINCSVGDETIKFDNVNVIEDGKPVIDIDHHESVSGGCHKKWIDISRKLAENGLFVEDITKNGHSVIGGSPSKTPGRKPDEDRKRSN